MGHQPVLRVLQVTIALVQQPRRWVQGTTRPQVTVVGISVHLAMPVLMELLAKLLLPKDSLLAATLYREPLLAPSAHQVGPVPTLQHPIAGLTARLYQATMAMLLD